VTKLLLDGPSEEDGANSGLRYSIYTYFGVSSFVVALCWALFEYVKTLPYSLHYINKSDKPSSIVADGGHGASAKAVRPIFFFFFLFSFFFSELMFFPLPPARRCETRTHELV